MALEGGDGPRAELQAVVLAPMEGAMGEPVAPATLDVTLYEIGMDSVALVDVLYAIEDHVDHELGEATLQVVIEGGTINGLLDAYVASRRGAVTAGET
jgi:acyl carrier protein